MSILCLLFRSKKMEGYKEEIKRVLKDSPIALHVETIRKRVRIGHWNTASRHCLEMLMVDEIKGLKTSNGWVFWIPGGDGF